MPPKSKTRTRAKSIQTVSAKKAPVAVSTSKGSVSEIRTDGWQNIYTGVGIQGVDKRLHSKMVHSSLTEEDAETLYANSDIAARIVDQEPHDAMRQWIQFSSEVDDLAGKLDQFMDEIHVATKLTEAYIWGRLYGGAAVLINVDDNRTSLAEPLNISKVRAVNSLVTLSRYELKPEDIETELTSPHYGEPIYYRLKAGVNAKKATDILIHRSRLLLFYGSKLAYRQRARNDFWGDSVLTRCLNAIRNYDVSNDAVAIILQEFNVGIFKMKGLGDALLAEQDDAIMNRIRSAALGKGLVRMLAIDSENEDFVNIGAQVGGIPEMVKTVTQRLVTATGIPHTKLLGESPSGLGATGESEKVDWNDYISNQQEQILRPKLQYLINIILASKQGPSGGRVPDNWSFEFKPLTQPSETDILNQRKTQSEIDKTYLEYQVLTPDEVRNSRFGTGAYSTETFIEGDFQDERPAEDTEA